MRRVFLCGLLRVSLKLLLISFFPIQYSLIPILHLSLLHGKCSIIHIYLAHSLLIEGLQFLLSCKIGLSRHEFVMSVGEVACIWVALGKVA